MASPILFPTQHVHPSALARLPVHAHPPGTATFVVTRAGDHGGQHYEAGDVIVCRGVARHGDEVVLVATGFGRPRLGHLEGKELVGDAGERCHPSRWMIAGRVVAVHREGRAGWLLHPHPSSRVDEQLSVVEAPPRPEELEAQLGLFERAA